MLESFDDKFEFLVNDEPRFFFELFETGQICMFAGQVLVDGKPEVINYFFEVRTTFSHLFLLAVNRLLMKLDSLCIHLLWSV